MFPTTTQPNRPQLQAALTAAETRYAHARQVEWSFRRIFNPGPEELADATIAQQRLTEAAEALNAAEAALDALDAD
jgi:hypothetical protein